MMLITKYKYISPDNVKLTIKKEYSKEMIIRAIYTSISFVMMSRVLVPSHNKSGMARGIYGTKRHVMKCVRVQA